MNWPAALSVAVLRVTRTAAGRRALQVAVLVGGLFVFGFLCGERAHAAEGAPSERVPVPALQVTAPLTVEPPPASPAPESVRVDVVAPVVEKVVRPVGELVEDVTEELAEVPAQVPALPSLPTLPALPALPTLPAVPELPEPSAPPLPGQTLPAPDTGPQYGGGVREPSGAVEAGGDGQRQGGVAHGPRFPGRVGGAVDAGDAVASGEQSGVPVSQTSGRQAPGEMPNGVPGGALGDSVAVDGGGPRHGGHGDAHAVALNQRAPVRLVPGVAPVAAGAETRDRYRDIPVFPG